MRIEFEKFANISKVDIEFANRMNILVGNNGTGKTLLLEAYSKINDYILEQLSKEDNFISRIVSKMDIHIRFLDKSDSDSYNFEINLNLERFTNQFKESANLFIDEINGIVSEEILYSRMEAEGLRIDFGELTDYLNSCLKLQIKTETIFDVLQITDLASNYADIVFFGNQKFRETILSNDFTEMIDYLKRFISQLISRQFLRKHNIGRIVYIPSERVYSMSKNLERLVSKKSFLRYAEQKFMTDYESFKEMRKFEADFGGFFEQSEDFNALIGGKLKFKDGEVVSLVDQSANEIIRELFSTKQNKLHSLAMLEDRSPKGLLIIEEPEAHLSIQSIFEMFDYLTYLSKNYQIVISTHSDIMLTLINNWYLDNPEQNSINGWEIIENLRGNDSKNRYVFKNMELADYGLLSEFVEKQLTFLNERTLKSQQALE